MKESGFYKVTQDYIDLIHKVGGTYRDNKSRPIFCCIQDKNNPNIYWAIPTSDIAHRTQSQIDRIQKYCAHPDRDISSCFYHIGHTDRPAIFKVSNALPLTEKYIESEYTSQGNHLVLRDRPLIVALTKKLSRILFDEQKHPNKYEQHMTDVYNHLSAELKIEKTTDKNISMVDRMAAAMEAADQRNTERGDISLQPKNKDR